MGLRERLFRWLAGGEDAVIDPDRLVEVAEVALHEGPMLVAQLERAGIQAAGTEAFNWAVDATNRMRIVVRAADAPRAVEVIQQSNVRPRGPLL